MSIGDFKGFPEEANPLSSEKSESKKTKRAKVVFQTTLREIEQVTSLPSAEFKTKLTDASKMVHKLFALSKDKENKIPEQTLKELSSKFSELPETDDKVLKKLHILQKTLSPKIPLQIDTSSKASFWANISDILTKNPDLKTIEIEEIGSFDRDDLVGLIELGARTEPQNLSKTLKKLQVGAFSLRDYKNQGYPPLILHTIAGRSDLVASELQNTAADMPDPHGYSALQWACYLGNEVIVEQLIQAKADLNHGEPLPLFLASREKNGIVELLIKNGADVSIKDKEGTNILAFLKAVRPPHWKKTEQLIKNQMCKELFEQAQNYSRVYQRTKLLSHVYSVKGTSRHLGQEINLTGYYSPIQASTAAKSVQAFAKSYPHLIERSSARHLAQSLNFAADRDTHTELQALQRIQKGIPTSFLTGYPEHSTTVLIWGDLFIHCNRGEGAEAPLEIYRFDPNKLNEKIIDFLHKEVKNKEEYKELITKILPHELDFSQSDNERELQKLAALTMQTVGNCSWASVEGEVKAYMLLERLKERSFVLPTDASEKEALKASVDQTFRSWQVFQQIEIFDKYLDNPVDRNIVFMSFLTLWTANASEPQLIARIQELEAKFKKTASYRDTMDFLMHKLMCRAQLYSNVWMDFKGYDSIMDRLLEAHMKKEKA